MEAAPGRAGSVEGKPVSDSEAADIINNLASAPLGVGEEEDFRISIAGVREKTALLRKDDRWFKPLGTTATTHILKPQIGRLPNCVDLSNSVENEYLCLKLLSALGIESTNAEIADFGGRRTLIVERFDRRRTRDNRLIRLPKEDCCQALSVAPSRKYQSEGGPAMGKILDLLKGSDSSEYDITTFIRASIVFWLLGATDGHAKNFSIFLSTGGRFRMTPLYDVLSAQPSVDNMQIPRKKFKLAMSVGAKRHYSIHDIMPRHFLQTAAEAGISVRLTTSIFDDLIANAPRAVDQVLSALPKGFPTGRAETIADGFSDRLRLCELRGG